MSKFNENDIVVVADLKDTSVYMGESFSEASIKPNKNVQVFREDDLRFVFISQADADFLGTLRQRRDEIMQDPFATDTETIKILSAPEIEAAQAIHISKDGDITFFAEEDEVVMERPQFGPGSYDV
ncbi:MAG: hypothetical protein ACRBDL_00885 [Alphaproteobacteria bacterium]